MKKKPVTAAVSTPRGLNDPSTGPSIPQAATPRAEVVDDLELVRRCQAGDRVAFGKLVERHQKKAFSRALQLVKNPDDALDVAQDAFVKVHRYIEHFQGSSSFSTWLYRIVTNLAIDHIRRSGTRLEVDFDDALGHDSDEEMPVMSSGLGNNPSENLGRRELAQRIQAAVDALPPYHRAVIIMREVEGLSYEEMAQAMKVSKGTIMSRLHHARQKLQRALGDYLEGDLSVK